jgi:hypothetical protein
MSDININNEMVARIVILVRQQMEVLSPSSRDLDLPATFDQICLEFSKLAADDVYRAFDIAHGELFERHCRVQAAEPQQAAHRLYRAIVAIADADPVAFWSSMPLDAAPQGAKQQMTRPAARNCDSQAPHGAPLMRSTQTVSPRRRLGFKAYAVYAAPARILRRGIKVRFSD